MDNIKLYRRRYIPDETVFLKDDEIIYADNDRIVTKWKALKPRSDFAGGMSVCYLKEGYKVSRMTDISGKAVFYYCDIVETVYDEADNSYTFNDLLADVRIYIDGRIEVVDIDELADAFKSGLITAVQLDKALRQLDSLLKILYNNGVDCLLPKKG
ncbi:DUF402 domain-containing protein [Lachnospiraceae bacterium NSJ-143]|nr:DUF402 domain-containing protein [Lachnospiraceae bacterium NSJ-143]